MVGGVFLSEGIQKFLFADVRVVEIVCGTLILIGLLTRLAAIALLIDIPAAIFATKIPILLGHGFWRFSVSRVAYYSLGHAARSANRSFHVAWPAVPADCRSGCLVD